MLSVSRICNLHSRSRSPIFILSHCNHLPIKLYQSVTTDKNEVLILKDEECNEFLPWLERKAGAKISSVLSVGKSKYGRSLFASDFIEHGDCILKVPFSVQISSDDIVPEIECLLGDEVANIGKLALVILIEQKKDKDSEWDLYIKCLPQIEEMHSTIFWSESELRMIQPSSVYQITIDHLAQMRKEFSAVKHVVDQFPAVFGNLTFEEFKHAYALVGSRAWGSVKSLSLMPFVDFLNHDGTSESIVLSDETKRTSEVIADRDYAPGQEVLIRYGKFPNSTLILDFGFTLPDNNFDQVQIRIDIPCSDHLRTMKMDILQRHKFPAVKDFSLSSSGGLFTLKDVRSARGKGRGIPQSLRAFVRVLCCNSPQELDDLLHQATQTDGRLARNPLSDWAKEIRAHQLLLASVDELIQKYDASIKSLRRETINIIGLPAERRRMAKDLLTGELRILKSVASWLKNYCASCPH